MEDKRHLIGASMTLTAKTTLPSRAPTTASHLDPVCVRNQQSARSVQRVKPIGDVGAIVSNRDLMTSQNNHFRSHTPRAFSPVVALATGLQLSIYARLDEGVILATTGMIIGILVAIALRTRGVEATNAASIVFWSAMVPAFTASCFAGSFVIAGLLR